MLTTVAFDHSRSRWLGIDDLIAEPEGPSFISSTIAQRRVAGGCRSGSIRTSPELIAEEGSPRFGIA